MQQINDGNPVSLNMVNEYTDLYTKDKLQLVPQERPWGFTEQAEIINGRIAMAAITAATALSASQGTLWTEVLDGRLPFFWG